MAIPEVISTDKDDDYDEEKTSSTSRPSSHSQHGSAVISLDPRMLSAVEEEFDDSNERKAQLCFGSCCDFVQACLIVDSVYFCFMVFINLSQWLEWEFFVTFALRDGNDVLDGDDDMYIDDEYLDSSLLSDCVVCTSMFQGICGLVFAVVGFVGAFRFYKYLVLLQGIWLCVDAILYCFYQNWASGLCIAIYIYPHIALFLALRSGTITRENYSKTEKYCCCSGSGD